MFLFHIDVLQYWEMLQCSTILRAAAVFWLSIFISAVEIIGAYSVSGYIYMVFE